MKYSIRLNMKTKEVEGSRHLNQTEGEKPLRPWSKKEKAPPIEIVASPDLAPSDDNEDVVLKTTQGAVTVNLWDISEDLKHDDIREVDNVIAAMKHVHANAAPAQKLRMETALTVAELGVD